MVNTNNRRVVINSNVKLTNKFKSTLKDKENKMNLSDAFILKLYDYKEQTKHDENFFYLTKSVFNAIVAGVSV